MRASAEAKSSLEFVSEIENNSVTSDDCSTISVWSPRYGSPADRRDRARRTFSIGTEGSSREQERYHRNTGKEFSRADRDEGEEGKVSSFYSDTKTSKTNHTQGTDDAKAILPDITDAKTDTYDTDAKSALTGSTDAKITPSKSPDSKISPAESTMERRGSGSMDVLRTSAALMTAGGAGLDYRVAIDSSPTREPTRDIASSSGKGVREETAQDMSTMMEDLNTAMGMTNTDAPVYLYVAPTPSPMASVPSVSAFSGRLLAHQISADPAREAERYENRFSFFLLTGDNKTICDAE